MKAGRAFRPWRTLPLVLLVTAAVCVVPVGVVWTLRSTRAVSSLWPGLLIAGLLSLAISWLVRACWTLRPHKSDLLFGELLPLGWLGRWRTERQLENGLRLLETVSANQVPTAALATRRNARLLERLADALDAQDMYLAGHSRRVARLATMLGRQMGLNRREVAKLRAAAAIHDVGKLHIPPEILAKPGRLTPGEFDVIKRHCEDGALIVAPLGDAALTAIVMHHHERFDGNGYPTGLRGEDIPMGARIVAVADTFDAITSARPYRAAASHREALEELRRCAGTQLDPEAVRAFRRCYARRRQTAVLGALLALFPRFLGRPALGKTSTGSAWVSNLATAAATSCLGAMAVLSPVASPLGPSTADAMPSPGASSNPFLQSPMASGPGRHTRPGHIEPAASRQRPDRNAPGPGSTPGRGVFRAVRTASPSRRHELAVAHSGSLPWRTGSQRARISGAGGRQPSGQDGSGNHSWIPPGQSGIEPPGLSPYGPPGRNGREPGHGGGGPPGLRGEIPPGRDKSGH